MRRFWVVLAVLMLVLVVGTWAYHRRQESSRPEVITALITRGDIVDSVGATGTLEAVTTVQVGTQVSGSIKELQADFNDRVRKGQVIARLDPSLFQTQVDQARAGLVRAQADVDRLKVALDDARIKLQRAKTLEDRKLIPASDLETAQVEAHSAEAQLRNAEAQVVVAQASLNQAEVNLQHTVITAPIDGIVIARNVDVGQTVAATLQAPTLFVLAADLTKMQVRASVDESDVGRIEPGQPVRFRVDAYPGETFEGRVSQVRLQPTVTQNVVTSTTVIDVPNPSLKLKPGMTANVTVEVARRNDVVRVPNAALRFRPTSETFTALGMQLPEAGVREGGRREAGPGEGRREAGAGGTSRPSGGPDATVSRVWIYDGATLRPVRVHLGITDGTMTELVDPALDVDTALVTGVATATEAIPGSKPHVRKTPKWSGSAEVRVG